jgi:tetratricopeptide (TPR) repeat protein
VRLHALSHEDSSQLVDSLLHISNLPASLRARILDKTEGNPFFVEEVVRTLIERGAVVHEKNGNRWQVTSDGQEIDIPGNVQALLTARIDRLEEDARSTLQVASVVGRSFYHRVLATVVDRVDDLDDQLLTLRRSQFIQEAARIPELEYLFRHALTQEAAYSTILLRRRRVYHRRVAETLEFLFSEQRDEIAGSLAFHFFHARDFQRALDYYTLAGDVASRLFAPVEAASYYSKALDCAGRVELTANDRLVYLYSRRGRAYELSSQFDAALNNYQHMVEIAEVRDDKALLLASLTAQCIIHATQTPHYNPPQAKVLGDAALKLARELGDRAAEARVLWGLLLVEVLGGGDSQQALAYGQQSLTIARELGLTEQLGYTLTNLVNVYWSLDEYEEARQANLEAREVWLAVNNLPMLADSYIMTLSVAQHAGDYEAAYIATKEALRISQSIGNLWNQVLARIHFGVIGMDQGDVGQAYKDIHEGLDLAKQAGFISFKYEAYRYLISLYLTVGALDQAEPLAEELNRNRDQLVSFFYSSHMGQIARLKVAQGKLTQAQQFISEAHQGVDAASLSLMSAAPVLLPEAMLHLAHNRPQLALFNAQQLFDRSRRAGARHFMPEATLLQGKALVALGEHGQARKVLREGTIVAADIGQRRILWQILAVLAEVETKLGNDDEARTALSGAREIVDYLANSIDDKDMQKSFLSLPQVQVVLDKSEG